MQMSWLVCKRKRWNLNEGDEYQKWRWSVYNFLMKGMSLQMKVMNMQIKVRNMQMKVVNIANALAYLGVAGSVAACE